MASVYRPARDGLLLAIRVTPRSSRDAVTGLHKAAGGKVSLAVKVRAVPDKGKANDAVIRVLAETLGLAASTLSVVAGMTDRNKTVHIRGDAAKIAASVGKLVVGIDT